MKMLVAFTLLVFLYSSCTTNEEDEVRISSAHYKNQPHFIISTRNATYYLEKQSGGFSGILDKNGTDWVQFSKSDSVTVPKSADSDFRGLPNLVYRGEQNGIGHPGFDVCTSEKINDSTILVSSKSGKYQFAWTFSGTVAKMKILKADTSRNYWFLYEGPIAGKFNPKSHLCFTDKGIFEEKPAIFGGNPIQEHFKWVAFGDENYDLLFYVKHITPDEKPDFITYMGNSDKGNQADDGMVVFGFGRDKGAKPLMNKVPNIFQIGFIPKSEQEKEKMLQKLKTSL